MFNTRLKELYQMRGDVARLTICPPKRGCFRVHSTLLCLAKWLLAP